MRKYLGFGLLLCVILIATLSGNHNSSVFAAATDANTDVQAIKNGKVVYYKGVNSLLYDELNEGVTFTKKVKDYNTKKWVELDSVTIVKINASKNIYFSKVAAAEKYIKTYKKKNNVTLKKVKLKTIKANAKVKYKKEAPSIVLKASTTKPTNKDVTVNVAVTDNKKVSLKKWAIGVEPANKFSTAGTELTDNSFTVSENGTYTVYALDNNGNKRTKSIKISNIDKTNPTISLSPSTTNATNENVTVTASIIDNVKVVSKKWASGDQTATYFTKNGTKFTSNTFNIKTNGTYTVFAKDSAGNTLVHTITISNINKTAPTITLSIPESDVTAVSKKIQVSTTDDNGIQDQKWAYGNKGVEYFVDKGSRIAPLQNANQKDKIITLKNGVYTVYAEDKLGNKAVKTITVDKISGFSEITQTGVHCEVCRMDLYNTDPNKVYTAKAIDQEGYTHYFCRIGCMYHQQHANGIAFTNKYVRDYGATAPRLNNWIAVENAVTVKYRADETAKGIMGWKLFHFTDLSSAANYLGVSKENVVAEKLENISEYAKTNNKGMDYQYEVDKAAQ
ncbi:nitrous oxide reductase accessory protein NosL [Rummeliibacillus sp. NPDC094406]|uniref:nitrous oxide reductase accessory protein NosL n=1 Tax=Rummeliibacillus sp. NPDC094406 TaxID=3364511 RepID=UPI0038176451